MTDPVRKSVTVPLTPQDAFTLFTDKIDTWWPKDSHSLAASRDLPGESRLQVDPGAGGKITETLPDGTQAEWGRITEWHPGERLGIDWYVGQTPETATRILVTFAPCDAGTRVDLVHSGWDIHGSKAARVSAGYATGWDKVLNRCFARAAARIMADAG